MYDMLEDFVEDLPDMTDDVKTSYSEINDDVLPITTKCIKQIDDGDFDVKLFNDAYYQMNKSYRDIFSSTGDEMAYEFEQLINHLRKFSSVSDAYKEYQTKLLSDAKNIMNLSKQLADVPKSISITSDPKPVDEKPSDSVIDEFKTNTDNLTHSVSDDLKVLIKKASEFSDYIEDILEY